jgi:hypothetical protein
MTLKIAVFAPIPKASVTSATMVNAGLLTRDRNAYEKSCRRSLSIVRVRRRPATRR